MAPIGAARANLSRVPSFIPDTIVDSFEDGDLSEYGGDTGSWLANTNTPVYDADGGSYSAKADFGGSGGVSISSTSGLPAYPSQGDTVYFYVHFATGFGDDRSSNAQVQWATQSESSFPDGYVLEFSTNAGELVLYVRDGGGKTELDSTTGISYPESEFLEVAIPWGTDDLIEPTVRDLNGNEVGSVSASDSTYTSGGVAYGNSDDQGDVFTVDVVGFD